MSIYNQRIPKFLGMNNTPDYAQLGLSGVEYACNVDFHKGGLRSFAGCNSIAQFDSHTRPVNGAYMFEMPLGDYGYIATLSHNIRPLELDQPTRATIWDEEDMYEPLSEQYIASMAANIDDKPCYVVATTQTEREMCLLVYYEGEDGFIHARRFGSGEFLLEAEQVLVSQIDGKIQVEVHPQDALDAKQKERALVDGLFFFDANEPDDAKYWLKVTEISADGITITCEDSTGFYDWASGLQRCNAKIRGGNSRKSAHCLTMFKGRLFAGGSHDENPRRLYWSCLPGDGRSLEDWTRTDVSIETSGGHVDVGTPEDGTIMQLFVMGEQLIVFTQKSIYRLYGYSPSNFTLEYVCENPYAQNQRWRIVAYKGCPYWVTAEGIAFFNGNNVELVDDNDNVKNSIIGTEEAFGVWRDKLYFGDSFGNSGVYCFNFKDGTLSHIHPPFKVFGMLGNRFYGERALFELKGIEPLRFHEWQGEYVNDEIQWRFPIEYEYRSQVTDLQNPTVVKKVMRVLMRGKGKFNLSLENEHQKVTIPVDLGDNDRVYKETVVPLMGQGRTLQYTIWGNTPFEIKDGMTFVIDADTRR